MSYKRFIPCLYLDQGQAMTGLTETTVLDPDPIHLAHFYAANHADELLIFDRSDNDGDRQAALDIMQEICKQNKLPVIGAGNINRLEDVKKLLYAGCRKAALNFAKEGNRMLAEEAARRFGQEKIAACINETEEFTAAEASLHQFVGELIIINPACIRAVAARSRLPMIVAAPRISLDKIMELFSVPLIMGLTGSSINENVPKLLAIKDLCRENNINVRAFEPAVAWSEFHKNSDGLVPVVVQDVRSAAVLMVAYMDETAYLSTLKTGKMTYYSRSRKEQWVKGDTSGHYQFVQSLRADCDKDTILAQVTQVGAACHTGQYSCFFNEVYRAKEANVTNLYAVLEKVLTVIKDRKVHPREGSYTNYLFDKGLDKILKKMGEEAVEIVIAAKNPNPNEIKYEISDFLYHMMVLMVEKGVSWEEIADELSRR